MILEEILANKELAYLKKKNEISKTDYSNVLFDSANKAVSSGDQSLEVLIYETTISKNRNPFMFDQYKNGYVLNHSVGMRYIKIYLCVNSDDPMNTQEKEAWDKYYPMAINPEEADKSGYFWAVTEAKNVEGSAVVKGSNFLTPVLEVKVIDENTISVKLAVSPSNVIDSHRDMHVPGIWKKSINENNYHLLLQEHEMDFENVISDSINDEFKVYTELISAKELLSKFTKKNIEAVKNTSKQEPDKTTQKHSAELDFGLGIIY